MSDWSLAVRPKRITFGLAIHTAVFALCAYYALARLSGSSLLIIDGPACYLNWPCAEFADSWPVTVDVTLGCLILVAAGIVFHVESLKYAPMPGRGRASLAYGVAGLLLPIAVYVLDLFR